MRRPLPFLTITLATLSLVLAACGRGDGSLVVLTASSLVPVATSVANSNDPAALITDAGSQVLVAQLRSGAPADVILLADPDLAAALLADGLAGPPVALPGNGLSLLTRRSLPLVDLARPAVRLVLADAVVPLGRYTREALVLLEDRGDLPVGRAAAIAANAVSLEDAARSVVAKVRSGDADAAIVYTSDAVLATRSDPTLLATAIDVPALYPYTAQVVTGAASGAAAWISTLAGSPAWTVSGFVVGATPR